MLGLAISSKIHFVGIGGIGMSGIAEILLTLKYHVSGSDVAESVNVEKLRKLGAQIYIGHKKENISGVTLLVVSSAIDSLNSEIIEAKNRGIPIIKRAEMLAELMRLKSGIAIAGTHGKTTTTSMLATILKGAGIDITYIIGGIVENLGGHAKVGSSEYLVAEADESDGTFLLLNPKISIITNIDDDHMNYYKTHDKVDEAFTEFANKVPFDGLCLLNGNNDRLLKIIPSLKKPSLTYGVNTKKNCESKFYFEARECKNLPESASYELYVSGELKGLVELSVTGDHNISNSLGAIGLALTLNVDLAVILKTIKLFKGVQRRMETLFSSNVTKIIDDYAHHPTEVKAVLKAIKEVYASKKIIAIFEPHRYTRTKDSWNEFITAFDNIDNIDELILLDIYPASEKPIKNITSEALAQEIAKRGISVKYVGKIEKYFENISTRDLSNSVVLTMGAGAIGKRIREIVKTLK